MTFKRSWEKADQRVEVSDEVIRRMIEMGRPSSPYQSHEVISGGCANLNIKVWLEGETAPVILRIYLRDPKAALRERKLALLLQGEIPIPAFIFLGEYAGQSFAIVEYKAGITLRDYLLDHDGADIARLMAGVGSLLALLHSHSFERAGFFDGALSVVQALHRDSYLTHVRECLASPTVQAQLAPIEITEIGRLFDRFSGFLPGVEERSLVHGDFDPANILVECRNGRWELAAVLDWEFAYSGSSFCDVANMLRYSHHMPRVFEESFLASLKIGGLDFPAGWRSRVHLLNLVSLLDCLARCLPDEQPNQCADIRSLIADIIRLLQQG